MSEVRIIKRLRRGMISLRGDLASPALRSVCSGETGVDFPGPLQAVSTGDSGLCWMSPDEVLILLPHDRLEQAMDQVNAALQEAHFMAENVSDARAIFTVTGPFAREVIAKNCPVDLHPDSFNPGDFRRSRFGQVAAAFWMSDNTTFEVICFASVVDYVQELLEVSAQMGPVGHF